MIDSRCMTTNSKQDIAQIWHSMFNTPSLERIQEETEHLWDKNVIIFNRQTSYLVTGARPTQNDQIRSLIFSLEGPPYISEM